MFLRVALISMGYFMLAQAVVEHGVGPVARNTVELTTMPQLVRNSLQPRTATQQPVV